MAKDAEVAAPGRPGKWKSSDDAKLLKLFRLGPKKGGCDPHNTHFKYIQNTVLPLFFPDRQSDYKNFGPLYKKKCAKFLLNQDLSGARGVS